MYKQDLRRYCRFHKPSCHSRLAVQSRQIHSRLHAEEHDDARGILVPSRGAVSPNGEYVHYTPANSFAYTSRCSDCVESSGPQSGAEIRIPVPFQGALLASVGRALESLAHLVDTLLVCARPRVLDVESVPASGGPCSTVGTGPAVHRSGAGRTCTRPVASQAHNGYMPFQSLSYIDITVVLLLRSHRTLWLNNRRLTTGVLVARQVQTRLLCDLDEDEVEAVESTSFDYGGKSYVLDLCPDHLQQFQATAETWTNAARPIKSA